MAASGYSTCTAASGRCPWRWRCTRRRSGESTSWRRRSGTPIANARLNEIDNAHFMAGDVRDALRPLAERAPRPDVVVVDPPRAGLSKKVVARLLEQRPRRIVYVSCNPTTLAPNARQMVDDGYRLVKVRPVDMFPHTPHIECVAILEHEKRDGLTGLLRPARSRRLPRGSSPRPRPTLLAGAPGMATPRCGPTTTRGPAASRRRRCSRRPHPSWTRASPCWRSTVTPPRASPPRSERSASTRPACGSASAPASPSARWESWRKA